MKKNSRENGIAMLEVLITIVILAIGLLGLAGLQSRLQVSQVESYQRSQALIIINDMASRIQTNRNMAASYLTTTAPLGTGTNCGATNTSRAQQDNAEICNTLQGAAEIAGGNKAGAMVGGRGCIEDIGNGEYLLTVAWQGLVPIAAPASSVSCGINLYDSGSTQCVNDLCRRAITTIVKIAKIT